jgi:tRNA threonylcarbamoyladenosine biosynthesis protein TsaE
MMQFYKTHSEDETITLGVEFAKRLTIKSVVTLFGDLGTGKTRFIKGVCKGLGVQEHVASPTFTLLNEYTGKEMNVFHFDFYRIKTISELDEIGFDEYLYGDGVCLIEWADRVKALLPSNRIDVFLKLGEDENTREISVHEIAEVES